MRPFAAVTALAAALAACSAQAPSRRLPDVRLATAAGGTAESLATCPTDKCLTVLVAPWCGVCRAEAPNIVQFRRYLAGIGVTSRVVIGLSDDPRALAEFARAFGADAELDPDGTLSSRSTPLFLVSDRRGRLLKVVPGFPTAPRGPAELARYLELI